MNDIPFKHFAAELETLNSIIRSVGARVFRKSRDHKQDREKWVVAMICKGIKKILDIDWYISMNDQDPPDAFAANQALEGMVHIEVVQLEKHGIAQGFNPKKSIEENIVDFLIEKKFKNKCYTNGTILFLHLDAPLNGIQFGVLFEKVKPDNLAEVWSVACIGGNRYVVACLYPEKLATTIEI